MMKVMLKKCILGLMMIGMMMICTACSSIANELENLGGWNSGQEIEDIESTEPESENSPGEEPGKEESEPSEAEKEEKEPVKDEGEVLPEITELPMNTDAEGEGLSVEFVENIGNSVLFKIVNNSNVCYEYVNFTVLFVPDAKEFYTENGTSAWHLLAEEVPAYGVTYGLYRTPTYEKLADDKEVSDKDKIYYDVVELGEIVGIGIRDYKVSDTKMQDASSYIEVTQDVNNTNGQIALFGNKIEEKIFFDAYVIYDGKEAGYMETSGFIPAKGKKVKDDRPNPGHVYCEATGDYRAVGYAGDLIAPAELSGMTLEQSYSAELYSPDLEEYGSYRIIIARAYVEFP